MTTRVLIVAALMLAALSTAPAHAQKATELYIPLGQSPGLSGRVTFVGRIESIDAHSMIVTLRGPDGRAFAKLSAASQIYIDRTPMGRSCRYGFAEDCQVGRLCEIKFTDNKLGRRDAPSVVEWAKIRMDGRRTQAPAPAPPVGFVPAMAMMWEPGFFVRG